MKLSDIHYGMKLRAIGAYADCIKVGDTFDVFADDEGNCCITCAAGQHDLPSTATDDGDLPEFEMIDPDGAE